MDQKQLRADVIKLFSKVNSRTWDCQCGWSRKVFICCKASWRQRSVSSFKWKFVLSIGSNQLSDLSKVCLPSVHVWECSSECLGYRLCMNNILHSNYWSAMKIEGSSSRRHWLKTHLYAGLFLGKIEHWFCLIYKDENFRSSSVAFTQRLILYCSDDLFSRLRFLISHKKRGKKLYLANFGMLS